MESFGKILKNVREEKEIDIDLVASETSISKEYLLALEEENLDVIPGSTYTAGFLRNYSDYLGCNTKYILDLYHAKIAIQSPTQHIRPNTPLTTQVVKIREKLNLDIDGNGIADLSLFLSDVSKGDANRGAAITMFLKPEAAASITVNVDESSIPLESSLSTTSQIVLFESNRAYPFTLIASFRGACILRYQSDKKDFVEDYFTSGDVLNCTSNNSLRLWISNANAVKMQIQGGGETVDIEIGKPGQAIVQDIRWIRDSQGVYKLVVLEVE